MHVYSDKVYFPCWQLSLSLSLSLSFSALKFGGRYSQLWWTALLHGLVVEGISYVLPDIDSFWHGHSSIIFFKQRLPLHILVFCKLLTCIILSM